MRKKNESIYKGIFVVSVVIIVILVIFIVGSKVRDGEGYQEVVGEHEHINENGSGEEDVEILPEGYYNRINVSGDFVLSGPQVYVLNEVKSIYDSISSETSVEDVLNKFDEVYDKNSGKLLSEYIFVLKGDIGVMKVVYDNVTGIIKSKTLSISSDIGKNVKLSSEIGTELADLPIRIQQISEGMSFDEVIGILGDKYLEVYNNNENIFRCDWYDIYENKVSISFKDNRVYAIKDVIGDDNILYYK